MPDIAKLRCYLIGGQSLLIRCAEVLAEHGHEILGVVTSDPSVKEWSKSQSIEVIEANSDIEASLSEREFDYLFSIANFQIISDEVLSLPLRGAVNFHDGPLPKYAGLNTPTWAIINSEKEHAICWHKITKEIDKGDILVSKNFAIDDDEIAFTLNAKCFDYGVLGFHELIDALSTGREDPQKQDLSEYRYFAKDASPVANSTIDWTQSAESISALVRSLDYGPYLTPMALPKLLARKCAYVFDKVEILESSSSSPGGTIIEAGKTLKISTGTRDILVAGLRDFGGKSVTDHLELSEAGLGTGEKILKLSEMLERELSDLDKRCFRDSLLWLNRLRGLEPLELPYAQRASRKSSLESTLRTIDFEVPENFTKQFAGDSISGSLMSAILLYFSRISDKTQFDVAVGDCGIEISNEARRLFETNVPFKAKIEHNMSATGMIEQLTKKLSLIFGQALYPRDLPLRDPDLSANAAHYSANRLPVAVIRVANDLPRENLNGRNLTITVSESPLKCQWIYSADTFNQKSVETMHRQFEVMLRDMAAKPNLPVNQLQIMPEAERKFLLEDLNATGAEYGRDFCIHELFESIAESTPDAPALTFGNETLSYRELNEQSNRVAHFLLSIGAMPDSLVGVLMDRSSQMIVAMLGVLKSGSAYVPMDPEYPRDRIRYMIDDADVHALITQSSHTDFFESIDVPVLLMDFDEDLLNKQPASNPSVHVTTHNLAYTIYTSGSTGKPKGVMVEHCNVANFFSGMDQCIECSEPGVWLAVTSISFDISVLELFWTLARGFHVVLHSESRRAAAKSLRSLRPDLDMQFSLFYWNVASDESEEEVDKYRLFLESAKYGDQNGFKALWTPERHFQSFGGLFPNPSVLNAALATITEQIQLRAGSCVVPLHSPIRIAEEWAVVDNLSNGRVGIAMAAGWQPNDFAIRPESFADAKDVMFESAKTVQKLWRGETLEFTGPGGDPVSVRTLPRPIQKELPIWVTTAGNPESYKQAARIGANVLTHLLGQSVEDLAKKINAYHETWEECGHSGRGQITLLLHTLVGSEDETVRELAREPMKGYLKSAVFLVKAAAWNFPTFQKLSEESGKTLDEYFATISDQDMDDLLDFAFNRYYETSGLLGSMDRCVAMVDELKEIGVDEIGCLIDFGVDTDVVLDHLPHLSKVKDICTKQSVAQDAEFSNTIPDLIERYGVTHLQCTPSQAEMLVSDPETRAMLGRLTHMMVGGEALPPSLARELVSAVTGKVTNMYGPTETTIWSTTHDLDDQAMDATVPIGRPISNTKLYVLDKAHQPVPLGVAGELYIGGDSVVRGYLNRDELTSERFLKNNFVSDRDARIYRTGDLVQYRSDGVLNYIGRVDNQVKILGYRIELGEIETMLEKLDHVHEAIVLLREDKPGDKRLVAYVRSTDNHKASPGALKTDLGATLPEFMVPSAFVFLEEFPLTPNGKVDRGALPSPELERISETEFVAPGSKSENTLAEIWTKVLGVPQVGVKDNFFNLGGHSLTAIQVIHSIRQAFDIDISLQSIFRSPVLSDLAREIESELLASASDADLALLLEEIDALEDEGSMDSKKPQSKGQD